MSYLPQKLIYRDFYADYINLSANNKTWSVATFFCDAMLPVTAMPTENLNRINEPILEPTDFIAT